MMESERNDFDKPIREHPVVQSRNVLVMTATIDPRGMPNTARCNPEIRLNDYSLALQCWLAEGVVSHIIFCENSGYDLQSLRQVVETMNPHHVDVEFLSCEPQSFPLHLGKGFGEIMILEHVVRNSRVLDSKSPFLKITGRLFLRNSAPLFSFLSNNPGIDVFCNLSRNLTYTDSRVFGSTPGFIGKYLCAQYSVLEESKGINFEKALARAVHLSMADGLRWSMLPVVPRFEGVSGTQNTSSEIGIVHSIAAGILLRIKRIAFSR